MGFPTVYYRTILNENPFFSFFSFVTFLSHFQVRQEVGETGQKIFVVVGNYCIQYEGICLSSVAIKVEQMDGGKNSSEILAQRKLRMISHYLSHQFRQVSNKVQCQDHFFSWFKNDLPDNLESVVKVFANDTLFSTVHAAILNNLSQILEWTCKWKLLFYPDVSKGAQEAIFSCKAKSYGN